MSNEAQLVIYNLGDNQKTSGLQISENLSQGKH